MSEFALLGAAADGMARQRILLDTAARNIAAAQASTPDRPEPRMAAVFANAVDAASDDAEDGDASGDGEPAFTLRPTGEPADAIGELIAALDAQRGYESDASLFDIGKRLAERTLDVGRA
jgi:flagellar basal body rod protein FlgC